MIKVRIKWAATLRACIQVRSLTPKSNGSFPRHDPKATREQEDQSDDDSDEQNNHVTNIK
jgi:hypothetical protein